MTGTDTTLRQAMQQTLDGTLNATALLRRFVSHDGWRMPVEVDASGSQRAVMIKDNDGLRFQLAFSDEQAYRDAGRALGPAVLGDHSVQLAGRDLFAGLSDDPDVISINWGSPPELFFKKAQFPSLRRWARAAQVEQTLASPRPDLSLLKHFDAYYIVLQKVEGGYALTLAPDRHDRKIAAVFTAEDTLEAFLKDQRSGQINFEPITRTIPGEHLFDDIKDLPLDGIAFNCSGPMPRRLFIARLAADVMAAA